MEKKDVQRKDLLTVCLGKQVVSKVEIKEVTIPPKGKAAFHLHPCPVIGHVVSGSVLYQKEGEESRILKSGEAFYEPRNKHILHFDNASATEPLVFIAYYLVEKDEELIQLIND